ncbi:hypothetical protein [Thiomicrorhabdus aquaedulcis]|nr:hypothetical protein [Thiomicrorhabdus aquaedulcis]
MFLLGFNAHAVVDLIAGVVDEYFLVKLVRHLGVQSVDASNGYQ